LPLDTWPACNTLKADCFESVGLGLAYRRQEVCGLGISGCNDRVLGDSVQSGVVTEEKIDGATGCALH
jgi:hypothetical protein